MPTKLEPLKIVRLPQRFVSDDKRVITRFLRFGPERIESIMERLLLMPEDEVPAMLARVRMRFANRHHDIESAFRQHFHEVQGVIEGAAHLSRERKLLIGAYFTMEYSIESAALFNPSIVPHPDQSGVPAGSMRFLMSMRATGEGHISSIVFRRGVIDAEAQVTFDPPQRYAYTAKPIPDRQFDKALFFRKLGEMNAHNDICNTVLDALPDFFDIAQLEGRIAELRNQPVNASTFETDVSSMLWLARANYELRFPARYLPSEMVIFPATENESRGMEDLRLVHFIEDNGEVCYYGTYTAYDGFRIMPMLIETRDFHRFQISTLNGRYVMNKGMAYFPRKVNGQYLAISRHDGENLFVLNSDNPHFWNEAHLLQEPVEPWELVQIGNSGSPLETEAGWILLTHGVGPVREYCIGAMLLDLEDPTKVLGRLRKPLIVPNAEEREGYVPNVVYSCGAMIHGEQLIIPYAVSDSATTLATVPVTDLLERLLLDGP